MHHLTELCLRFPKTTALLLLTITVALGAGLPRVHTEFGYRVLIGDQHPAIRTLDSFIERYGEGLPLQIVWDCLEDAACTSVFDRSSLEMAFTVTNSLEPLAEVRRVYSPANAPLLVSSREGFHVRRFIENGQPVPDAAVLVGTALQDPLWVGDLVSHDGRIGVILVQPSGTSSKTHVRVVDAVSDALRPFREVGFRYHLVGDPVDSVVAGRDLNASTGRLIPLTILVIALVLRMLSRSWPHALSVLLTILAALVWTFGLLGWLRWPQDGISEALAPLILVVGVCDGIHLLTRWVAILSQRDDCSDSLAVALSRSARDVGAPCLLTTLTTTAAFASFSTSELATFVRFGLISAFGVITCLFLTFSLLPLLLLRTTVPMAVERGNHQTWCNAIQGIARTAEKRGLPILIASVALLLFCGLGWITRLRVDNHWYEAFGDQSEVIRAVRFVQDNLRPSETLEVDVALPPQARVESPATLNRIEGFASFLASVEPLGDATSIVDLISRLNRLLHGNLPVWERVGDTTEANAELIELLSLEDPEFVEQWLGFDRSTFRISVEAPEQSYAAGAIVLSTIRQYIDSNIPSDWTVRLSGPFAMNVDWIRDVQGTQLRSFPTAFFLVFLMVSFFFRSVRLGLAAMVPALLPVVITLGVMGWVGMSLDVGRAMIAAILLGISVDDSIHLLDYYRKARELGEEPRAAIRTALLQVGRAVVTTSVALALGFLTLMTSAWKTISSFGFFVAIAVLGALAATLFVLPSLLAVLGRPRSASCTTGADTPKRDESARKVTLGLAILAPVAVALGLAGAEAGWPTAAKELGCWILPNARVALLPGNSDECPLHPHEQIEAAEVGGNSLMVTRLSDVQRASQEAELSLRLAVLRNSETTWHAIPLRLVSREERVLRLFSAALLAGALLCIPMLLLAGSRSRAVAPFAFLYSALSVILVMFVAGRGSLWLNRLALLAAVMAPAILSHLSFAFPRERKVMIESPGVVFVPYGLSAIVGVAAFAAMERDPLLWPTVVYLLLALSLGAWLVLLLSCFFAVRESASPVERTRARVLLYGAVLLPILPTPLVTHFGSDPSATLAIYLGVSIVLIPLPIAFAISRYNLLNLHNDARTWVARFVYYGAAAALITVVFEGWFVTAGTRYPPRDPVLLFALALLCIAALELTRSRLLGWVEGKLLPRLELLRSLSSDYGRRIDELQGNHAVARLLGDTLSEALGPSGGCVFLSAGRDWEPAYPFGQNPPARVTLVPIALEFLAGRSIAQIADVAASPDDSHAKALHETGVELISLMRYRGNLHGLLLLGHAQSSTPYTRVDLDFTTLATHRAAVALHNAALANDLVLSERRATTGRTALALAHDLGKEVGLIGTLARRLPDRLRDAERTHRDVGLIGELAEDLLTTIRSFVEDATSAAEREAGMARLDDLLARTERTLCRIHGPGRIVQSLEPGLRGAEVHEHVERVLLNVIDNALLASPRDRSVHVFGTREENAVHITVRDRGCGMSERERAEAFELGFTTRAQQGGSGIGLAVSREIVGALGGRIDLEENPGGGTLADLRIPGRFPRRSAGP